MWVRSSADAERRRWGLLDRKARKHLARLVEHARVAGWLIRDLAGFAGRRLLWIVLSDGLHLVAKFAAMGIIYVGVQALSKNSQLPLPLMSVIEPRSTTFLVLTCGAGVLLLVAAAVARYETRRRSIRLAHLYMERCMRRVVALASRLPDPRAPSASRLVGMESAQQLVGHSRACALSAREVLQLAPTMVSFAICGLLLSWLDPGLTAILSLSGLVAVAAQYPANSRTANASRRAEKSRREAASQLAQLLARLRRDPVPLSADDPRVARVFASEAVRASLSSYAERLSGRQAAALASRIGSSVLLGSLLLIVGIGILEGTRTWAGVVTYLAAARFALSDFVSLSRIASSVSRNFAQIALYRQFVVDAAACLAPRDPSTTDPPLPLRLRVPGLAESSQRLVLAAGDVIAIVTSPATRASMAWMILQAATLGPRQAFVAPAEIEDARLDPTLSLRANLGLDERLDEVALAAALADFAPTGVEMSWLRPGLLDRAPSDGWEGEIPRWALRALRVVALQRRGLPMVAMPAALLAQMPAGWQAACRARLGQAVLLVVHRNVALVGRFGERAAMLAGTGSLTGWVAEPASPAGKAVLGRATSSLFAESHVMGWRRVDEEEDESA